MAKRTRRIPRSATEVQGAKEATETPGRINLERSIPTKTYFVSANPIFATKAGILIEAKSIEQAMVFARECVKDSNIYVTEITYGEGLSYHAKR